MNKKSKEQKPKQKTSNDATSSHASLQQANLRKVSLPAYYIHNNQPRFSTTPGQRSVRLSVIIMARLPFPGAYDCLASIRKGLVFGNEATVAEATLFGSFQKQKQQCNSPVPPRGTRDRIKDLFFLVFGILLDGVQSAGVNPRGAAVWRTYVHCCPLRNPRYIFCAAASLRFSLTSCGLSVLIKARFATNQMVTQS